MTTKPPTTTTQRRPPTSSTTIPASRPPCTIHPTAIIADKAILTGTHPVTIGANVVIHPYARIRAEAGRVVIGSGCTVAEGATVGLPEGSNSDSPTQKTEQAQDEVVLDRGVNVESGAEIQARFVGEGTEVGINVRVGAGASIGKYCKITPLNSIAPDETLEDFTVVYGYGSRRVDRTLQQYEEVRDARLRGQLLHVEVLRKLIPNGAAKWSS